MKDFLILMLIFSATITFAQSKIQIEPVKQSVESEDMKKEMKETPNLIEPEEVLLKQKKPGETEL